MVAMMVEHAKQNTDNPEVIDALLIEYLIGVCKANGVSEQLLAFDLRRFFDIKTVRTIADVDRDQAREMEEALGPIKE